MLFCHERATLKSGSTVQAVFGTAPDPVLRTAGNAGAPAWVGVNVADARALVPSFSSVSQLPAFGASPKVIPSLLMQRPGEPRVEIIGGEMLSNRQRCDAHRGHHQLGKSRRRLQCREGIQLRHYIPQFLQSGAAFLTRFDV